MNSIFLKKENMTELKLRAEVMEQTTFNKVIHNINSREKIPANNVVRENAEYK